MRVVGDPVGVDVKFRRAIERWQIVGPMLQTSARARRPSHRTAGFLATAVDGEEALRRAVRENFFLGADWIKLFVSTRRSLTGVPAYPRNENPARLLGLEQEIGALRPGMRADLIAVEGAPLTQIEAIRDVRHVVARGRQVV